MSKETTRENEVTISEKTNVPIGVAVGCGIAFITGAFWISNGMQTMRSEIVDLRHSVSTLNRSLEIMSQAQAQAHSQYIERVELQNWILRVRIANQTINIPDLK